MLERRGMGKGLPEIRTPEAACNRGAPRVWPRPKRYSTNHFPTSVGQLMHMLYRAARVFADEGFGGLFRRAGRKVLGRRPPEPGAFARDAVEAQVAAARIEFQRQTDAFRER